MVKSAQDLHHLAVFIERKDNTIQRAAGARYPFPPTHKRLGLHVKGLSGVFTLRFFIAQMVKKSNGMCMVSCETLDYDDNASDRIRIKERRRTHDNIRNGSGTIALRRQSGQRESRTCQL
jgi:hypothetical protein